MLYRNEQKHAVVFKIGALSFSVPPGGECDIAPDLAYVIQARGLPLVPGGAGGARVEPVIAEPPRPPRIPGIANTLSDADPDPGNADIADAAPSEAPAVASAAARLREQGVELKPRKKGGR